MKRKAVDSEESSNSKRQREQVPDYCNVQPRQDDKGATLWPASPKAIEEAQTFLREWYAMNLHLTSILEKLTKLTDAASATSQQKTLIVPDKDADGLDAGVIIHRTLTALGATASAIDVHLVGKGNSIHDEDERKAMMKKNPKYIIVVDQGSRPAPAVVDDPGVESLIIDHHLSDEFPKDALWEPPFPDMKEVFKIHTKKNINDAVSLLNAPRRTAKFDVLTAWQALLAANSPKDILTNRRLLSARAEINEEVERQTHTAPKFSKDGKIAVFRINSAAQVHPVIATRWAGHLKSPKLEIVLVANFGYLPDRVNFSCRIARCARNRDPPVNIISSLKAVADLDTTDLVQRLGEGFARGHKEASGGSVPVTEFEELMALIKVGEKPDPPPEGEKKSVKKTAEKSPQKNKLDAYFAKKP
ncbi:MAG: hypothetical protein LQ338_008159 [Usnochroma carphineum]|nr:MAG: hypothetical protein LQ338_008159 [Usnochroma carphineum]